MFFFPFHSFVLISFDMKLMNKSSNYFVYVTHSNNNGRHFVAFVFANKAERKFNDPNNTEITLTLSNCKNRYLFSCGFAQFISKLLSVINQFLFFCLLLSFFPSSICAMLFLCEWIFWSYLTALHRPKSVWKIIVRLHWEWYNMRDFILHQILPASDPFWRTGNA